MKLRAIWIVGLGALACAPAATDEPMSTRSERLVTAVFEQEVTPPHTHQHQYFGYSLGLHGAQLAVGAEGDDTAGLFDGAVFAFSESTGWTLDAQLLPAPTSELEQSHFGTAVALDGATLVVSEPSAPDLPGAVHFYELGASGWTATQTLGAPDPKPQDGLGTQVALHGDVAVATRYDTFHPVVVFRRTAGSWAYETKLPGQENYGLRIAVHGDTLAISQGDRIGVWVHQGSGAWTLQTQLFPLSTFSFDTLALHGDRIAASAGSVVHVFERTGSIWNGAGSVTYSTPNAWGFGHSIALTDQLLVVGAATTPVNVGTTTFSNAGVVYLYFQDTTGSWQETTKLVAPTPKHNQVFGTALASDGVHLAVGAPGINNATGAAYVFAFSGALGAPCQSATDCASGFCTDGVCCNTACTGVCSTRLTTKGSCTPLAAGTECGPASCVSATEEDPADLCDGTGACLANASKPCAAGHACTSSAAACVPLPDASIPDSAAPDATASDADAPDAVPSDAAHDVDVPDFGVADAAHDVDAPDALHDADAPQDGSGQDGSGPPDAGAATAAEEGGSCGCTTPGKEPLGAPALYALLLGVGVLFRRTTGSSAVSASRSARTDNCAAPSVAASRRR